MQGYSKKCLKVLPVESKQESDDVTWGGTKGEEIFQRPKNMRNTRGDPLLAHTCTLKQTIKYNNRFFTLSQENLKELIKQILDLSENIQEPN